MPLRHRPAPYPESNGMFLHSCPVGKECCCILNNYIKLCCSARGYIPSETVPACAFLPLYLNVVKDILKELVCMVIGPLHPPSNLTSSECLEKIKQLLKVRLCSSEEKQMLFIY